MFTAALFVIEREGKGREREKDKRGRKERKEPKLINMGLKK